MTYFSFSGIGTLIPSFKDLKGFFNSLINDELVSQTIRVPANNPNFIDK